MHELQQDYSYQNYQPRLLRKVRRSWKHAAKKEFRTWPTCVNRHPELFNIIRELQDSPDESAEDDGEPETEETQFWIFNSFLFEGL